MAVKTVYGASAEEIGELFGDYLEGGAANPAIAVSMRPLAPVARNAIEKSLEAFGFSDRACSYVTLLPRNSESEGGDIVLDAQALYLLIEGLDPLYLIVTDKASAETIALAYRAAFDLDAPTRLMGRPCAVFEDLASLLTTDEGKRAVWKVLKRLK
jgi:hypothetical protein